MTDYFAENVVQRNGDKSEKDNGVCETEQEGISETIPQLRTARCGGGTCIKMIQAKSAEYYMSLLNVKTAKIIALICVLLVGGVYHGALHLLYGVTPCKGLLKDGIYKAGSTAFSFRGDFNQGTGLWQPWGCMMHKYTDV